MGRPPIPEAIVRQIEVIWAEDPTRTGLAVYEIARKRIGDRFSARWVQQILKRARRDHVEDLPDDKELVPWGEGWPDKDDPDGVACLYLLIDAARRLDMGRLTTGEAFWALRVHGLFDDRRDEDAFAHINIAATFAKRARAAKALNRGKPHTDDLDKMLSYRVWESQDRSEAFLAEMRRSGVAGEWLREMERTWSPVPTSFLDAPP